MKSQDRLTPKSPSSDQAQAPKQVPMPKPKLSSSKILRAFYIFLSCLSLSVGTLGLFIPGLPTVEFVLLAAFFASRGSERLHQWFYQHRLFGPMIRDWQQYRRISRKSKYMASISMSIAALVMIFTVPHPWFVAIAILSMVCVLIWIWRRNEK